MKSKANFMLLIVLAALLVGCTANRATTTLLEFQRTGGIAGLDDRLVIGSTGKATLTRKDKEYSFSLSADELSALQDELAKLNFTKLEAEYLPANQGADLFDYRLTIGGYTVHMVDTAVPEGIQPVLEILNELIGENS